MTKRLRWVALAFLLAITAMPAIAFTQTNVLQTLGLTLTIYQQGAVNTTGKKLPDIITAYNTKSLIAGLESATGVNFGTGAKLVQSTAYAAEVVPIGLPTYSNPATTNLPLATNASILYVGQAEVYGPSQNPGVVVISNNTFISNFLGNITTNIISNFGAATTNTVTIPTNGLTILTPTTNDFGQVTNVSIMTEDLLTAAPTTNLFTNVSTSIDILYGGASNFLYDVSAYFTISPLSPEIVVESGKNLGASNQSITAQNGFSLQGLDINYFSLSGPANLSLNLEGFVKQTLKIDTLSGHGASAVTAQLPGATESWNVIGSGYSGGGYTSDPNNAIQILNGFVTNANPVVVEGTVTFGFLKNLPQ